MSTFVTFTPKMRYLSTIISLLLILSCSQQKKQEETPWGTVMDEDGVEITDTVSEDITLADIINQGEMIMLTLTGPKTYYDYRGHGMGLQYLLCERFASSLGVKLRVDVCKDSVEMIRKLTKGEGDIIAYPINDKPQGAIVCGPQWAVASTNTSLADTLRHWYRPEMVKDIEKMQRSLLANGGVIRHVYSPMLDRSRGIISKYDALFIKYATVARLDWRLLAAQCYQESCFDPNARSWAGACGLMQIMPGTAAHLGLPTTDLFSPEPNISAAARYMHELMGLFSDAASQSDRICFALAAYNGGHNHVRDAMALAQKNGRNPRRWNDVQEYILKLSQAQYYTDPVVRHGYMRGSETVDYVARIRQRWAQYGGRPGYLPPVTTSPDGAAPPAGSPYAPQRATKKHKYHIQ